MAEKESGFTDSFLEMAYRAVVFAGIKSEEERKLFEIIVRVCESNGVSFRKYMMCLTEINQELKKLQQEETDNGEQQ